MLSPYISLETLNIIISGLSSYFQAWKVGNSKIFPVAY